MADVNFSGKDLAELAERGLDENEVRRQLALLRRGMKARSLVAPCTVDNGILRPAAGDEAEYLDLYEQARSRGRAAKFVPASGAATRMFQFLFNCLGQIEAGRDPGGEAWRTFTGSFGEFAFTHALGAELSRRGKRLQDLVDSGDWARVLGALLPEAGLGYATLPKGLLAFHRREGRTHTPVEEHLLEAEGHVADAHGNAAVHFTLSPEHREAFAAEVDRLTPQFAGRGIRLQVSYSVQSPATDTIAVNPDGTLFRQDDGCLLFRPGGHGSLIRNLDELGGDLVFIKNIDNVVPEPLLSKNIRYKKLLGGLLLWVQGRVFAYLRRLQAGALEGALDRELAAFAHRYLGLATRPLMEIEGPEGAAVRWRDLLDRPLRVCGMVLNRGEPGGGPYWVQQNGQTRIQIVESAEMDRDNPDQAQVVAGATHFNPVDIVCGLRDVRGRVFDLGRFVDPGACFIAAKSMQGRPLLALERPGLWNGAMAHWNSLFVEVPLQTFNPVKTVNDLLRPEHR